MKNKKEISERKRNNARLYPLYKMFSWDLICFYSIEFLFYTIAKKLTASEVLITYAFYIISKILMQIPAVIIADMFGKRKGIIIGNILIMTYICVLVFTPGMIGVILADLIFSLGYNIKTITETNLLYDSVSTRGGEGLYSKLDSKGSSWYYCLDGITCLSAGYLFVINNYLPMIVCFCFALVSTILSFSFKDIYPANKTEHTKPSKVLKEYVVDLRISTKFIIKSERMKSLILFGGFFTGLITIIDVYKSNLLLFKGIPEEQFAAIFAILTLIAGISVRSNRKLHKKFKNRTLSFLSLLFVDACLVVGIITNICSNIIAIPIIIMMYAILKICSSNWYVLKYKYLKNFSTESMRNKIMFTYELIGGIIASIMSLLGSLLLEKVNINLSFLIISLTSAILLVLILHYIKPRFGLKPNQYKREDIEMKDKIKI